MTRKRSATPYLFLVPALLVLGVFVVYPIIAVTYYSFTDYDILSDWSEVNWVGFDNYRYVFTQDPTFWHSVQVTVLFAVIATSNTIWLWSAFKRAAFSVSATGLLIT